MAKKTIQSRLNQPVQTIIISATVIAIIFLFVVLHFISRALTPIPSIQMPPIPPKINSVVVTPLPIPTIATSQIKAVYTFYIQATSHKITSKGLGINSSDSGKTFTADIGTFVDVDFGRIGKFHVSVSSPQDIFKCVGSGCLPHSSPANSIFSSWVTRPGFATIQVIETK